MECSHEFDPKEFEAAGVKGTDYIKNEIIKRVCKALENKGAFETEIIDKGFIKLFQCKITYIDPKLVKELTEKEGGQQ